MSRNLFLISLQPIRRHTDPIKQWNYYKQQITNYVERHEKETKVTTLVSLPEYALGNSLRGQNSSFKYDDLFNYISEFAKDFKLYLIAGSAAINDNGLWKNRSFFWDNTGNLVGTYDKQKLFNYEKKMNLSFGSKNAIFIIPDGGISVQILICSDLWYPELIRENIKALPDVLVVPAMSVVPRKELINYGKKLWFSLALTRSRESVIPILVSDWAAQSFGNSWASGASTIINPGLRWTNEMEYNKVNKHFSNGESGCLGMSISLDKIEEYRKYRKEVGLLPQLDEHRR